MDACCHHEVNPSPTPTYRRVLVAALVINAVMFVVEVVAGWSARSSSLQADALDFLGDSANYGVSLLVLARSAGTRARVALAKGVTMGALGLIVLVGAVIQTALGTVPEPETMGSVAAVALLANLAVAVMLYRYRSGDSNMRSVWLCSRNDVVANLAVLLAASGVFAFAARWPDLVIAVLIAGLAVTSAVQIVRQARQETRTTREGRP